MQPMDPLDLILKTATLLTVFAGFAGMFMRAGALVESVRRLGAKTAELETKLGAFVEAANNRLARLEARDEARRNEQ